ncbi:MAG: L-fucose isomerase [Bacteroidales bacterium]|nr:L-fucose isomerase [Bacteroidales bacterium]
MKPTHPRIGIRPIIDGRRFGPREALEETTMGMARSVKELYESTLHYNDGSSVECVIADTTIGGVAEAEAASAKFRDNRVGAVISVTPCWCYGSETIDMDPIMPKAIWGINKTERPGAVYLAAALAAHNQKGLPAFGIYGSEVQDKDDGTITEDVREKLLLWGRAAVATMQMRGQSYLTIGSVSMGIAGSIPTPDFFQEYLGMRNEYVDTAEISRRIKYGIFDQAEYEKASNWIKQNCKNREGKDYNRVDLQFGREDLDRVWDYSLKMALIFRDLMIGNPVLKEMGWEEESCGHNAIVGGFQGQRQWTDHMPNGDFAETILNTSFDWNGTRRPYTFATENDTLNGVTMLLLQLLTNRAQMFSDVRTYWSPESVKKATGISLEGLAANGFIHLLNSGATTLDATGRMEDGQGNPVMKPFWEVSDRDVEECLKNTSWMPADRQYFRGGGFSTHFRTRGGMPMTMCRINLIKGLGPVLQIAEGWSVNVPDQVFEAINIRTDRTWPTTFFAPRIDGKAGSPFKDVYSVMNNWGANHGAISFGHVGAEMITLASMLRIPVCMHNVSEDKIFRPSAWAAFGMDKEGSDYRACANYGPIYK